jgi:hypothetical protein
MIHDKQVVQNKFTHRTAIFIFLLSMTQLLILRTRFINTASTTTATSFVHGFHIHPQILTPRHRLNQCCTTPHVTCLQFVPKSRLISHSSTVLQRMAIVDEVTAEMKVAMKAKDTVTLNTIRLIRSAFANTAIELRTETLTDDQV